MASAPNLKKKNPDYRRLEIKATIRRTIANLG